MRHTPPKFHLREKNLENLRRTNRKKNEEKKERGIFLTHFEIYKRWWQRAESSKFSFEVLFRERDSEWCEDCPEANSSVFAVGVILAVGAEISDNDVISDCFVSDLPMDD